MYFLLPQVGFEPNPLHKPELDSTAAALRKKPRTFLRKKGRKEFKKVLSKSKLINCNKKWPAVSDLAPIT
jgi:hypothetical protein